VLPAGEDPGDATAAAPAYAPEVATGTVVVRTVPSGASVTLRGRALSAGAGGGYTLPVGTHTLEITSPSGESTRRSITVREGDTVELCWSFDANSICGG
jgi:hypothetical protein